jgi:hypothetical protein
LDLSRFSRYWQKFASQMVGGYASKSQMLQGTGMEPLPKHELILVSVLKVGFRCTPVVNTIEV